MWQARVSRLKNLSACNSTKEAIHWPQWKVFTVSKKKKKSGTSSIQFQNVFHHTCDICYLILHYSIEKINNNTATFSRGKIYTWENYTSVDTLLKKKRGCGENLHITFKLMLNESQWTLIHLNTYENSWHLVGGNSEAEYNKNLSKM